MNEVELIIRIKAGEKEAWKELYDKYIPDLLGRVISRIQDVNDAADVVQEALLKAWLARSSLKEERNWLGWFYRILINAMHDLQRRQKRRSLREQNLEVQDEAGACVPGPEQPSLENENTELIRGAISQLSTEHCQILTLYYLEERSIRECAELTEIPVGTVRTRIHRARLELRDKLASKGFTGPGVNQDDLGTPREGSPVSGATSEDPKVSTPGQGPCTSKQSGQSKNDVPAKLKSALASDSLAEHKVSLARWFFKDAVRPADEAILQLAEALTRSGVSFKEIGRELTLRNVEEIWKTVQEIESVEVLDVLHEYVGGKDLGDIGKMMVRQRVPKANKDEKQRIKNLPRDYKEQLRAKLESLGFRVGKGNPVAQPPGAAPGAEAAM